MADSDGVPQGLIDVEFDVIGILLSNPDKAVIGMSDLSSEFMVTDFGRLVFREMTEMADKNLPTSASSVSSSLSKKGELQTAGGRSKLLRASREAGDFDALDGYIDSLREWSLLGQIKDTAKNIEAMGTVDEAMETVGNLSDRLQKSRVTYKGESIASMLPTAQSRIEAMHNRVESDDAYGIPTGYPELDDIVVFFSPGDYVIIAGRPGMGKTALGINISRNAVMKYGKKVGFISIEMEGYQLVLRFLCLEARVDSSHIRKGTLTEQDLERLALAFIEYKKVGTNLMINHTVKKFRDVKNAIEVMYTVNDCDMVIVDYLQNISDAPGNSVFEQVTYSSSMLQGMKKKYPDKVTVGLAQLKRLTSSGPRTKKKSAPRPTIEDLRGSGDIEQDADTIIMIHRPEEYGVLMEGGVSTRGRADLIVGKQRNGTTGQCRLKWVGEFSSFESLIGK